MFSEKQKDYFRLATHRWNVKTGAARSGKTYMDYFVIPKRIRAVKGLDGLNVMIGHTQGTLERNVIMPLQNIWGTSLVGSINSGDNIAYMFGEPVICLGADKITAVDRIRGMSIKYCYGDEVVTWHRNVFNMLESRLDKDYSRFDGTCNPDNPHHWFYEFLYKKPDIDRYVQEYRIYDNPFLSPDVVRNMENEYRGSVDFDRLILGHWVAAEGIIYRRFADDISSDKTMLMGAKPELSRLYIGVDFGGSGSAHTFVCTGSDRGYTNLYGLLSERIACKDDKGRQIEVDPEKLGQLFCDFVRRVIMMFGTPDSVYCDSAEQTLILGLKSSAKKNGLGWLRIENALKTTINDRIRCAQRLMAQGRFRVLDTGCESLINALSTAVWDPKSLTSDVRLDDGTSDIDTLDAFEYTFERDISRFIKYE
ncbi:terminase large subunit domain-containing protein [Ruminococcus flavefaciens]|uniref:terminase large subunit domain-containing protein n=1 Tax=Ruminococcus flavefaciens TaxID=1265 RepID=UPI003F09339B